MKKFLVSVLAIAGLVACNNEEVVMQQGPAPMEFAGAFVENATRANDPSITTTSLNAFDVWAYVEEKAGTVLTEERVTRVDDTKWTYGNKQYWTPNHNYYFTAIAPVDTNHWTYNQAEDKLYFSNDVVAGAEDLLYAYEKVSTHGTEIGQAMSAVALQFEHLLSKVNFKFKNGFATSNVSIVVKDVQMTAPKAGTYQIAGAGVNDTTTGEWSLGEGSTTLVFGNVVELGAGASASAADERLTIPASAQQSYTVSFTVELYNGTVKVQSFDKVSTITGVELEKGKAYNFVAEITPENLDLTSIEFALEKVLGWDQSQANDYNYDFVNDAFVINNAEGLAYFAQQVNAGNTDWTTANVVLGDNIDLSAQTRAGGAYEWTPIGLDGKFFEGTFDGKGYTISNFSVTREGHAGLFGYARARIKNLNVENVTIEANHYAGAIVGQGYCNFDNCHVKNVNITLEAKNGDWGDKAGGIIGQNCEGAKYIKNCTAEGVTIKGYRDLGGIAGMAHDRNIVTDCSVKDITIIQDLSVDYQSTTPTTLGGVVGRVHSNIGEYANNTEENVYIAAEAKTSEDFAALLKKGGNIILPEGEYTFPAGNVYAGEVNVVAAPGANVVVNLLTSTYISGAKLTLEGLTFKVPAGLSYNESSYGFIHHAAEFNMNNCVIEGGRLRLNVAEANINNCQFNVTASSGFDGYGLYYYGNNGSTVNVSNSTFTALQKAIVLYNEGNVTMNLNVDNCTFTASQTTDKAAISIHSEYGINGNVNITNSTATGFADFHGGLWRDVNNNIGKDNKNFTVYVDGELVALKGYGDVTCGYYADGDTYTVLNGNGFKNIATDVLSDGSKNVTIKLADDIDLAGIEWPAVRTNAAFVLDGKGYAIKNLTTSAVESDGFDCTALFTSTRKATTIKNLVVDNATVTGNGRANSHGAVLVATPWAALNIEGVTVKNSTVSSCDRSSVLVTYLYFQPATVKNCVVEGCTVNSIGTAGALLGMNNSKNFEATGNTVKNTTISSSEGGNKAGILIGTWQKAGTLTESGNVVENSKAINAGTETNNNIGRTA